MKVLLADDSMTIRMILKNLLNELGITDITEARNGQEALDILSQSQVDLILTDIHMPIMDGLTFLENIKTRPESKHRYVPVVVISSDTDYRQIERAKNFGAFGYIKKPFKRESLEAAIKAARDAEARRQQEEALQEVAAVSGDVSEAAPTTPTDAATSPKPEPVGARSHPVAIQEPSVSKPKKGGLLGWMRRVFGRN